MAKYQRMSLCLSDIRKDWLKKSNDGRIYLNATIVERKSDGIHGETHFVKMSHKNEQGEWENVIIGNIYPDEKQTEKSDDLPF